MSYFINRECVCGCNYTKKVTKEKFETEVNEDFGGCVSVKGDDDILTYQIHSCSVCHTEQDEE